MKFIPDRIRQIIHKELRGTASKQEQTEIDNWFESFEAEFEPLDRTKLEHMKQRHKNLLTKKLGIRRNVRPPSQWKVAASLLILVSLGLFVYLRNLQEQQISQGGKNEAYQTFSVEFGKRKTLTLPDGSVAKLFGPASLEIHSDFKGNRATKLSGQAFFDVVPDSLRPFTVQAGFLNITVLGTSFLVEHRVEKETTVAVRSGQVKVDDLDGNEELLGRSDRITFDYNMAMSRKTRIDPERYFLQVENILLFENTPLTEVLEQLRVWYGLEDIAFEVRPSNCSITGKYQNRPLREILESISYATALKYELNEKKLTIKSSMCKN